MNKKYDRNPNINCLVCKSYIYRKPSVIKNNSGHVFCNKICYGIFCRKETPCIVCRKPIISSMNKKTCSRECANRHRAGIKYKINRPQDIVKSQKALKIRLMKQRGKICERCNYDIYEILQTHHKNRDKNDNRLENLELICPNCHAKEHFLEKSWLKNFFEKRSIY